MSGDTLDVRVRPAAAGDAATLALVGAATFLETFAGLLDGASIVEHCRLQHAEAVYAGWLARPDAAAWLAEARPGDAAVGLAVNLPPDLPLAEPRPGDVELKRIYLLQRFHGRGVGAELLRASVADARRRGASRLLLGVYERNERALAFYARAGFRRIGERMFRVGHRDCFDHILALDLHGAAGG